MFTSLEEWETSSKKKSGPGEAQVVDWRTGIFCWEFEGLKVGVDTIP